MFYETKAEPQGSLYVCMSVLRPISPVAGNAICVWLFCMYSHCIQLQFWE